MCGLIITDLDDTSIRPTPEALAMKKKSANARLNAESKESLDFHEIEAAFNVAHQ